MGRRLCKKLWYTVAMSILSIFYFSNSLYGQCMPGDIGGTVFRELPANGLAGVNVYGVMDANESGLPGITVTVTDVNDVVQTTTTDFRGDWWITPAAYPVRVEFTWSDAYLEATTDGSNNQIVRIENAADCGVNLGVQYPTDYAQAMPEVIVNCYVPGDPLGGGTSGTLDAVVTFPYGRTGTMPEPDKDVLMSEIGATWGLAYNPYTEVAFVSAMMKRHVGLGPLGIGGIYAVDYSGATPVTTTLVDLDAMGINLGTEPVRNLAIDFDVPESDSLMFDTPGKMGMGDLDISDDGQTLYVVNLNDKEIVAIDLTAYNASGTLPTMSEVSSVGLIPSPGCAFGASRPFGLKYYQGKIYAGVVCSGENGGTALDLSATVYAYDLATSTWNTALATFPLDYTRGEVVGGSCTAWEPWISTYDGDFENCSPSPLLSSLDFDVDGSMIMAFTDRYTLQKFTFQRNLTDTQSETVISGGELLRASPNAGSFVLESAGTTANGGGCGANGEGPNGGEYYCGDLITPDHFETVMGAIAILHGTDDAIVTVMNPIDGTFNSGGVKMFNNNDGTSADGYLLYQTTTFPGGNGNAVKGGGLGDIELLKEPAPVEICSYLWMDSDNDGSYDAGETGLIGIEVSLLATDGTTVGTTITDANGGFCFNNNLEYFTDYYLAIGTNGDFNTTTGIIQDSLSLTFPNNTSGLTAELHDSDAIIANGVNPSVDGYPYLAFNTGGGGMNTNDLATGFSVLDCPVINNPSAPQTICSGDTITSLQVGTDATDADAIAFVYFADQQTGSDMYSGGIPLDTVTPSGGLAIINDIVLPLNGTASAEDYFIYAITNPVTGDINCRPFEEIIITISPAPNVSITSNSPICEGTDIMLNENGGVAVDWNWQGPAFSAGSIQNPTILNATAADNGMYYVTITDALTCTNVDSTFVNVTGSGSITFGNTGPFCVMQAPENITATPSGGTFSGTGITDGALGTFDPSIAGTGVTTITYNFTDGNGCSGSATLDVAVLASPTVTLDPIGPFCVTDPDTLLVGLPAGGTYTGVGIVDGINGRFDPGVAGPGTHTISYTFTNAQNCSETATADITVGAIPSVVLNSAGPFCRSNPPVVLTGSPAGGLFYGVGITDTVGGVFDPSVATAGTNTIQYVFHHPDGCSNSAFTDIIVPVPNIQITAAGPFCSADAATILNATPAGGTFSGTGITNGASGIFDPNVAGAGDHVITYNYTDGNGCLGTGTSTITVSDCNGTFGDFVWIDNNNNGIQEIGEPGFNNLTVNLYDANTDMLLNTTTTDNMGMYMFTGLTSGDFYIIFDTTGIGEQYAFSPTDIGSDNLDSDANSAGQTPDFMGTAGFDVLNIDAGLVPVADIGDFVFNDLNNDGIQDVGEPGIEGVTVNLYDANTDGIVATVMTDANGNYTLDRIPPGDYYIEYDPTTNVNGDSFVFAPQDATTDDLDSDINPSTGFTPTFTFDPTSGDDTNMDAGFIQAGSIGDFVFADYNGNGIQEAGEPGIGGVMVVLNDNVGTPLDTVFTDVSGNYTITGVTTGNYFVSFDITTNTDGNTFLGTPINATTDDLDSDIDPIASRTAVFAFDPTTGNDIDTDAGFIPVMTIGDFVFDDVNEDGIQDVGEAGIEGVTVTLHNAADGAIINTTTTDAMGLYSFPNTVFGNYYLSFDGSTNTNGYSLDVSPQDATTDDFDSDIDPATNQTASFIVDPLNGDNLDVDAGFFQLSIFSIGNFVWQDNNGNGIQDAGEPGLIGVDVFLADAVTDALIGSATTDASGAYQIDNVPPGNYYIFFDNSNYSTYNFSPQDATTDDLDSDTDAGGQTADFSITNSNNFDFDAGLIPNVVTNTIGDFVFEDLNGDGIQDVGEPGIEGVTVSLFDDNDVLIATTTTDGMGAYVFTGVAAGDYYINFDATTNTAGNTYNASPPGVGADDLDSDINPITGSTAIFTFDPTMPNNDMDAGFSQPIIHMDSIGDFVFEDLNEDGIQDVGENGIEGVTISLFNSSDSLIATTMTDAMGAYIFNDILAGDYYVNFDATTNTAGNTYVGSLQDMGGDDTADSDVDPVTGNTVTFTFDALAPNDDIDAGFYQPAVPTNTIGDFVFEDLNEDGIQDGGEPGIEGVTVNLYDNNDVLIATTTTDASGAYIFTGVPAGDYYINFDATTNTGGNTFSVSPQDIGGDDTADSDVDPATGNTVTFTFDPSAPNDDIDAGFFHPAVPTNTIGDFVFEDLNEDGIQDGGEPGIEGVTVNLYDNNDVLIATTTTDASGAYIFTGVPAGDYYINFDATTNTGGNTFSVSPQDIGGDDTADSDVDPATGNTITFTFDGLAPNNDIDAGFFQPAVPTNTIGDFVFQDLNGDGIQDLGEPGIEGVTVTLFDDNDVQIAMTTTDANGAYAFNNIPAGSYYVNFDVTTNTGSNTFINSPPSQTIDDSADSDVVDQITGNTATFTFDALAPNNDIDAGFIPTNTIGDFVFEDVDEDGIQGLTEIGIEGVTVELFDDNDISFGTTTTDANGAYQFTNVPVGDYYVNFDVTTNTAGNTYVGSPQDMGGDDGADSDADAATGNTEVFPFDALAPNNDIDAGFFQGCPEIDAGPDVTICEGTSTQLGATLGGTIYLWTPTATLDNPGSPTPVATPTVTTTYIVNVSGTCNGTDSVTVFVNPQSVIDMVNSVDPSACDAMDGSIQVMASGGQAPLQYSIDGGVTFSTNNTFNNLVSGNYDVLVANADSTCMSPSQLVTLTQDAISCPILFSNDTLLVADGRAPTVCIPVSIDDTMNYEITVNGALYTDPILGCTVDTLATPGMEINLGGIGIYEIAFNNTSTCCQDTLTLAVQGTIQPDTLFEVTPFETTTTTLCADTSDLVGNFSTLSLCQTPANGMANLDGSACITYTPNTGFVGTDTLCLVACDEFGACDTTVMFLQVQPEICPDFITLENESIMLANCSDNGTICVNIDLLDLNQYSIFDNGSPYAGGIQACGIDTLNYYDYSGLPGAGLTGPYMVDNWTVNGVNFSGLVPDMESLKDSMNVWDPTGNWIHVPANTEIRHVRNTDTYSRIDITETVSSAPGIMNMQQRNQPVDIELTFGAGTHEVIFRESATGCEDTVNVSLTCMCPPLFAVDTVTVAAADCDEDAFYCTPILLTEFINYNVSDNGNPYTQQIQGCDFDSLIIYNYDNFPNQGNSGPYQLDSWIVDGQTFSMNFNTIPQLVDSMNVWDVNGNWSISNNFSIDGGDLTRNYGPITIVQFGITVAVSPADLQPTPSKVSLPLPIGFHELIFENTTDGCIDTLYVNAECNPCPEYFMDETLTLDAGDCTDSTELCISVLPADISNYTITDNGAIYNNGFVGCDFDSIQSYLTTSFNSASNYQLDSWMISGVMFGPLSFTDPAALTDSMNVIDPTGNWNYSGLLITGGNALNTYGDLTISDNGTPVATVTPSPILRANGTAMLIDTGFHVVIVTDDLTGCTDTISVQVDCTPAPVCPDFISIESQMLSLADCNDVATACVPVTFNDASRFAITDNGMPYTPMLTACGADTVLTYETVNVPGSGPYDLEDWIINGTMFSGRFDDLAALADSMNVWDNSTSWMYDQTAETITGANPANTYSSLSIRQLLTNSLTVVPGMDVLVGGGTNIELAAGFHEMIFERPDGCMDTIAMTVDCINPDTILANLVIGITDTICLDTSDLLGNIIDIDNVCPDASGTSTSVNFLDGFTCFEVTGLDVGMDTACIVMCDDLGVCDTTTFVFNTTSNQVSPPTANPDTANTTINTSVDIVIINNDDAGNQTIDNFFIVEEPANGTTFLDPNGVLTYIPALDYCNDDTPDTLMYGICNASGCDSTTVTIYIPCDTSSSELVIHNGFSPNNDGVNDVFMIQGLRNIPNNSLCVFNRWGNQVYRKDAYGYNESGQYDEGTLWDGSWTGQVLPDGTYFYLLDDGNGNKYSGYVQIHR